MISSNSMLLDATKLAVGKHLYSEAEPFNIRQGNTMKILLWIVGIIFLVGLLVVGGVLDLIF